jgi:hypothetical protein
MEDEQQAAMPTSQSFLLLIDVVRRFLDLFGTSGKTIGADGDGRVIIAKNIPLAA